MQSNFRYESRKILLRLTIPISANKFTAPLAAPLTVEQFGQKWGQLGGYLLLPDHFPKYCLTSLQGSKGGCRDCVCSTRVYSWKPCRIGKNLQSFLRYFLILLQLKHFKLPEIPNMDPRPENIVCAGILHTTSEHIRYISFIFFIYFFLTGAQIGVLVRVEPDQGSKVFNKRLSCSFC